MKSGSIVNGKIISIKNYGAFVQLDENNKGLIHISEFSDRFVKNITDYVNVGDDVTLQVLSIDQGRISLSYKSLHRKKRCNIRLSIGFQPIDDKLSDWIEAYQLKE